MKIKLIAFVFFIFLPLSATAVKLKHEAGLINFSLISSEPINVGASINYISSLKPNAFQIGYTYGNKGKKLLAGWVPAIECTEFGCGSLAVNLTALNTDVENIGVSTNRTNYGIGFEIRYMFLIISQEFYKEGNYNVTGLTIVFPW